MCGSPADSGLVLGPSEGRCLYIACVFKHCPENLCWFHLRTEAEWASATQLRVLSWCSSCFVGAQLRSSVWPCRLGPPSVTATACMWSRRPSVWLFTGCFHCPVARLEILCAVWVRLKSPRTMVSRPARQRRPGTRAACCLRAQAPWEDRLCDLRPCAAPALCPKESSPEIRWICFVTQCQKYDQLLHGSRAELQDVSCPWESAGL